MNPQQRFTLIVAALLSLLVGSAIGASAPRAFLPLVATGAPPARTELIYSCQCGGAVAWVDESNNTVMVTFLAHNEGGRVQVGIDDGTAFKILTDTLAFFPGEPFPAFDSPGLKDAPGMAVKLWGKRVLYIPMRTTPQGNYNLWRVVW